MKKIAVGILGATGTVGQQYVRLLAHHPLFEVAFLCSSESSSGKTYKEAINDRWQHPEPIPLSIASLHVYPVSSIHQARANCSFVFSALTNEAAKGIEEKYAEEGIPVVSSAGYHRQAPDIPLIIPEINAEHLKIIPIQQRNRGWKKGFIITKPNCSLQSYMIPLHPLHQQFKVKRLFVTTLQAVSGAGYPGISSLDISDNVIPYIANEEEKSEREPLKIWGSVEKEQIRLTQGIEISAHCNRVPVMDGHLACISVQFEIKPGKEEVIKIWEDYQGLPQQLSLPSAPTKPIIYREEINRPQPRLDRHAGNGMAVTVGRLRECPLFDYRFVALSHNTLRGAAGGGVLCAELLHSQGYL